MLKTHTEQKTTSPADSGVRAEDYSAPIWSHPRVIVIASAVLVFAACYTRGFILPNTPISLWGDHVGFFNDGSYIVAGDLPFRDYFQIVPPGTDLVYALLIKLFGIRIWIPNLLIALVAGTAALLMTSIALRVMRGWLAILPAILLAGPVLHSSMDPTHHWFSTLAILAAVLTLSKETRNARVALAGAWCGVAICFTQTK